MTGPGHPGDVGTAWSVAEVEAPVNVLLADDSEVDLLLLEDVLASSDYCLKRAMSGEQALALLDAEEFAVMVLDGMMPGMDGFDVARRLRGQTRPRSVPIIFLTGAGNDARLEQLGYEAGAVDYLGKPVDGFMLRSKVLVFVDLFRTDRRLRREVEERKRLAAHIEVEHRRRLEELEREKAALLRFAAGQPATPVTARLSGERPLQDAAAGKFADLRDRYVAVLEDAVDGRVHVKTYNLSGPLQGLGMEMAFLGAGPRDVVDMHKSALAKACDGRPEARVRVVMEEARYLLVELMGYLAATYRSYYRRQVGLFRRDQANEGNKT